MMKKTLIVMMMMLMTTLLVRAQIGYEASYSHSGAFVQLTNSGYKFYLMDVGNEQCRIYNTDHSIWKTINLNVPDNHYLYDIRYVSENLFTNDNTLALCYIYYNYDEVNQFYTYTAKVITEGGTELLSIPGAQYVYVNSLGTEGTKLTVYVYDYSVYPSTIQTVIYSLPGQLVSNGANGAEIVQLPPAYPNPAVDYAIIPYEIPGGADRGKIILNDEAGKMIRTYEVDRNFKTLHVDTRQFPKGIYFYHIENGDFTSEAGKIIVR